MSAKVRLGTQGWSYDDWRGTFYPPGSKQEDRLPFYASVFDTVEIDSTFYHPPKGTIARSWARHTPEHFRFAAKVPRAITHDAHLRDVAPLMDRFAKAMEPLGDKLGPVLVQMPAEFHQDATSLRDLDAFLAGSPRALRLAVEFRHASWHTPEAEEVLRRHGAAMAWTEWRDLPRVSAITADFLYLRWLGDRQEIASYDRVQIDREDEFQDWEGALLRVFPAVKEVFGYFNNHWAGHSPASVNEMKHRLSMPAVNPLDLWPQRELF